MAHLEAGSIQEAGIVKNEALLKGAEDEEAQQPGQWGGDTCPFSRRGASQLDLF